MEETTDISVIISLLETIVLKLDNVISRLDNIGYYVSAIFAIIVFVIVVRFLWTFFAKWVFGGV